MMPISEKGKRSSSLAPQILAAFTANIGAFSLGLALSWSSPVLPHLADCGDACEIEDLGKEVASWIGSLLAVGCLFGTILGGWLMGRIGLRRTMILMALPFTLGWLLLFLTKPLNIATPPVFYMGRILTGIGGGSYTMLCPSYTAETSELRVRGAMGTLMQLMLTLAILFNNAVGSLISWTLLTAICGCFPVLVAVGMFFMPESPYFLLSQGQHLEAERALQWLRGTEYNITEEVDEMKRSLERKEKLGEISFHTLLTHGCYAKPLIIVLLLMFFQQYSGINGVFFYLQDLFKKAGSNIDPGLSSSLVSLTQVLVTFLAVGLVDKVGRKVLLILSAIFMAFSLSGLATFFFLDANKQCEDQSGQDGSNDPCLPNGYESSLVDALSFVPLLSLMVYIVAFSIGFGPLPWVLNGELFSLEAKAKAATIATVANWTFTFLVSKFQVTFEALLTTAGLYFAYAGFCAAAIIFLIFFVPESKGKTPQQLKQHFQ